MCETADNNEIEDDDAETDVSQVLSIPFAGITKIGNTIPSHPHENERIEIDSIRRQATLDADGQLVWRISDASEA